MGCFYSVAELKETIEGRWDNYRVQKKKESLKKSLDLGVQMIAEKLNSTSIKIGACENKTKQYDKDIQLFLSQYPTTERREEHKQDLKRIMQNIQHEEQLKRHLQNLHQFFEKKNNEIQMILTNMFAIDEISDISSISRSISSMKEINMDKHVEKMEINQENAEESMNNLQSNFEQIMSSMNSALSINFQTDDEAINDKIDIIIRGIDKLPEVSNDPINKGGGGGTSNTPLLEKDVLEKNNNNNKKKKKQPKKVPLAAEKKRLKMYIFVFLKNKKKLKEKKKCLF
jgi:hypothetical protein